jgi:hypothetical protein
MKTGGDGHNNQYNSFLNAFGDFTTIAGALIGLGNTFAIKDHYGINLNNGKVSGYNSKYFWGNKNVKIFSVMTGVKIGLQRTGIVAASLSITSDFLKLKSNGITPERLAVNTIINIGAAVPGPSSVPFTALALINMKYGDNIEAWVRRKFH